MKFDWDREGAIENLGVKECTICEEVKPVYVVVTHHGKKDLHFPCCSPECADICIGFVLAIQAEINVGYSS